jgi:hypothetical protein
MRPHLPSTAARCLKSESSGILIPTYISGQRSFYMWKDDSLLHSLTTTPLKAPLSNPTSSTLIRRSRSRAVRVILLLPRVAYFQSRQSFACPSLTIKLSLVTRMSLFCNEYEHDEKGGEIKRFRRASFFKMFKKMNDEDWMTKPLPNTYFPPISRSTLSRDVTQWRGPLPSLQYLRNLPRPCQVHRR